MTVGEQRVRAGRQELLFDGLGCCRLVHAEDATGLTVKKLEAGHGRTDAEKDFTLNSRSGRGNPGVKCFQRKVLTLDEAFQKRQVAAGQSSFQLSAR